jgi:hypothetical protein
MIDTSHAAQRLEQFDADNEIRLDRIFAGIDQLLFPLLGVGQDALDERLDRVFAREAANLARGRVTPEMLDDLAPLFLAVYPDVIPRLRKRLRKSASTVGQASGHPISRLSDADYESQRRALKDEVTRESRQVADRRDTP